MAEIVGLRSNDSVLSFYLLDIDYTRWEVGCQVNFLGDWDAENWLRIHSTSSGQVDTNSLEIAAEGAEDTEKKKFEIRSTTLRLRSGQESKTNPKFKCSNGQNQKESRMTRIRTD
jgi:hypothetical protein